MGMGTQAMKGRFGWASNSMPDVYCHLLGRDADDAYLKGKGITKVGAPGQEKSAPGVTRGTCPPTNFKLPYYF